MKWLEFHETRNIKAKYEMHRYVAEDKQAKSVCLRQSLATFNLKSGFTKPLIDPQFSCFESVDDDYTGGYVATRNQRKSFRVFAQPFSLRTESTIEQTVLG
jgi:hypothetical protein